MVGHGAPPGAAPQKNNEKLKTNNENEDYAKKFSGKKFPEVTRFHNR